MFKITPADQGILAVTLDDCYGLGDDETCEKLEASLIAECNCPKDQAWSIAYDFFRSSL